MSSFNFNLFFIRGTRTYVAYMYMIHYSNTSIIIYLHRIQRTDIVLSTLLLP
nr:MAG TPA: hypothetical protein [Caudoviricetes sp.]